MKLVIDATNVGGGGGVTHLYEILKNYEVFKNSEITKVIVYSSLEVQRNLEGLHSIVSTSLYEFKTHEMLNRNLVFRLFFQLFLFDKILKQEKCDVLFSLTGDYLGKFDNVVGMSRNMLLYERDIWREIDSIKEKSRFYLNFIKQRRCFRNAKKVIFISNYAKDIVTNLINLSNTKLKVIHHGVADKFSFDVNTQKRLEDCSFESPFRLIYTSTIHVYKNQCNLVKAVDGLRKQGVPIELNLVGGIIYPKEGDRFLSLLEDLNSDGIIYHGNVNYEQIQEMYAEMDGVVYASTCENMPNILIESMKTGLPIICSNKLPMPEFLEENGFYFNPKSIEDIRNNLLEYLNSPNQRYINAINAKESSNQYTWETTAKSTLNFILD